MKKNYMKKNVEKKSFTLLTACSTTHKPDQFSISPCSHERKPSKYIKLQRETQKMMASSFREKEKADYFSFMNLHTICFLLNVGFFWLYVGLWTAIQNMMVWRGTHMEIGVVVVVVEGESERRNERVEEKVIVMHAFFFRLFV